MKIAYFEITVIPCKCNIQSGDKYDCLNIISI